MAGTLSVKGYRELNRAFARAPNTLKREYRAAGRSIAEPVRRVAETRALSEIRNMPDSPDWSRMRIGLTQRILYVAPRERGRRTKRTPGLARPNLKDLLLDRSMIPALYSNGAQILARFDAMLASVGRDWERN